MQFLPSRRPMLNVMVVDVCVKVREARLNDKISRRKEDSRPIYEGVQKV